MAKSARRAWQDYADNVGMSLAELFNENIRETVKTGVRAIVTNTKQDSGRAAYHWVVIPNRGRVNPGAWKELKFNPAYGVRPVGRPGDQGKNSAEVIKAVVNRESRRAIDATVKGRSGQATSFMFQSNVPGKLTDKEWGRPDPDSNYRINARLKEAKEAALSQMKAKWDRQIALGRTRKNPVR